jgi:hypothetical protein
VIVEHWEDNSVIVSEGFDTGTAAKLHTALRDGTGAMRAESLPQEEIGLRLFEIPAFQEFTREIGERVVEGMRGAVLLGQYRNEARGWALAQVYWKP